MKVIIKIDDKLYNLLKVLSEKEICISEATNILGVAPINSWKLLKKLSAYKCIDIKDFGKGRKKRIKLLYTGRSFLNIINLFTRGKTNAN